MIRDSLQWWVETTTPDHFDTDGPYNNVLSALTTVRMKSNKQGADLDDVAAALANLVEYLTHHDQATVLVGERQYRVYVTTMQPPYYRVWAALPASVTNMDTVTLIPISELFTSQAQASAWAENLTCDYDIGEESE